MDIATGLGLVAGAVVLCTLIMMGGDLRMFLDLHAFPGYQNQHWHSDNPTHIAAFWQHPHFQDRVVNLWQAFATRYRDEYAKKKNKSWNTNHPSAMQTNKALTTPSTSARHFPEATDRTGTMKIS